MLNATTIRTTCPRDCYDACGIVVKTAADGTINVVGDAEHSISRGALCGKCSIGYNGSWRDPKIRLTRPLKRSGPKGAGHLSRRAGTRHSPTSRIVSAPSVAATATVLSCRPTTRARAR
jgi:hypothetical protein